MRSGDTGVAARRAGSEHPSAADWRFPSAAGAAPWLALFIIAAVLLAHGALLPLGRWQGDEYFQGASARDQGFSWFLDRIAGPSPRPVSEAVLFAYYQAVAALRRPLIPPFLLLHWALLTAACFASMRRQPREAVVWRVLFGASLLCLFLLGHDATELFFWPAAVAPYAETLAALTLLQLLLLDGRTGTAWGKRAEIACLTVAAACSEAGAMFAIPYAAARLALAVRAKSGRSALGWVVPLLVAAIVLGVVAASARVRGGEPVGVPAEAVHRPLTSLSAAVPQLGGELLALTEKPPTAIGMAQGLAAKLLAFLAFRWCWRLAVPAAPRPDGAVAFAVATLAGALWVIAAAKYQYGLICCERHAALRQCWFFLAIAGLAALSAPARIDTRERLLAPALLVLAVGVMAAPRLPALIGDARLWGAAAEAREATWRSGLAPGPAMTWYPPPEGGVVHGADLPPGHFRLADDPPWWIRGLLRFFDKHDIDIVPHAAQR